MRSPRPIRRSTFAAALLAAIFPMFVLAGGGNPITVTTDADSVDAFDQACSLREALINANTNTQFSPVDNECAAGSGSATDIIVLSMNTTYTLTRFGADAESGDLDVANDPDLAAGIVDVHFLGTSADGVPIIVQSVPGERVLEIVQADVVLSELVLRDGATADVGGGIYNEGGTLLLDHAGLQDNSATSGGGIYSTGPVTLDTAAFSGNEATLLGGAVMQDGSTLDVIDTFIGLNHAVTGGGIYNDAGVLTVSDGSWFAGNTTTSDGAGIMNTGGGTLAINDSLFQENIAGGDGGAVRSVTTITTQIGHSDFVGNTAVNGGAMSHLGAANTVLVTGGLFEDNDASSHGGAIDGVNVYVTGTRLQANTAALEGGAVRAAIAFHATSATVAGNSAQVGGGVHAEQVYLDHTRVQDNAASGSGGGVFAETLLQANDSRVTGNTAAGNGAGIFSQSLDNADASVTRTLIAGNVTQGDGGGIWVEGGGTLVLSNSTISQNRAPNGQGSGIFIETGKIVRAINVTLADNTPGENLAKFGTLEMKNSIITTPGGIDCVVALEDPEIVSLGNNLSDDNTCIGLDESTDQTNVDVLLAPLAYTSSDMLTHALLAGSPAIDAGDAAACAATPIDGVDQRGGARDVGLSCDIGAHEQGAVVSLTMFGDGFE